MPILILEDVPSTIYDRLRRLAEESRLPLSAEVIRQLQKLLPDQPAVDPMSAPRDLPLPNPGMRVAARTGPLPLPDPPSQPEEIPAPCDLPLPGVGTGTGTHAGATPVASPSALTKE